MDEQKWLAELFEAHRSHLRAVAYRMLGSLSEAEDAVQETWLRLSRSDTSEVENFGGWLTTVVGRVCLNMLRSRKTRREESLEESSRAYTSGQKTFDSDEGDPEREAIMADSVGIALLVILEKLTPAERLAFVLHDVFAMPFEEIAPIVDRSEAATRQLASRARRRVRKSEKAPGEDLTHRREVVDAFLIAARNGDFETLVAVLDPEVVLRTDSPEALVGDASLEVRGAHEVARRAIEGGARTAISALVNGDVGIVVAPNGHLRMAFRLDIRNGRIIEIEIIAAPDNLHLLDLKVFDD